MKEERIRVFDFEAEEQKEDPKSKTSFCRFLFVIAFLYRGPIKRKLGFDLWAIYKIILNAQLMGTTRNQKVPWRPKNISPNATYLGP